MVIVFGTDSKLLGTFEAPEAVCEISGTKGKTMSVYARYFSFMLIPFFSLGKRVYSVSKEGHEYQEDFHSPEIQQYITQSGIKAKTPFYHYTGLLLALIITVLVLLGKYDVVDYDKLLFSTSSEGGIFPNSLDHLEDPEVGDLYLMDFVEYKDPYSIYKIVEVTDDSVYFNEAEQYFVKWDEAAMSIMSKSFTFPEKPERIAWGIDELSKYFDLNVNSEVKYVEGKGTIRDICRDEY